MASPAPHRASLVLLVLLISPVVWHSCAGCARRNVIGRLLLERACRGLRRRTPADRRDAPRRPRAGSPRRPPSAVTGAAAAATEPGDWLAAQLHAVAGTVRGNVRSLRTLLVDIYPPELADAGLDAALSDLVQANGRPDLVAAFRPRIPRRTVRPRPRQRAADLPGRQECLLRNAVRHAGSGDRRCHAPAGGRGGPTSSIDGHGLMSTDPGRAAAGHLGYGCSAD